MITTTDRIVVIDWSNYEDKTNRQSRWGGHINSWDVSKIDDGVYRISNSVNIEEIDDALSDVIRKSDQAILTYPYGDTDEGASAMRVRVYGKKGENDV
jgi:hypothetical protein